MVLNALEARAHRCYSEQQQEPREAVTLADCGRLHPWRVRGRGLATEASGAAGYSLSLPHLHTAGSNIRFAQTVSCFCFRNRELLHASLYNNITLTSAHALCLFPRVQSVFQHNVSFTLAVRLVACAIAVPKGHPFSPAGRALFGTLHPMTRPAQRCPTLPRPKESKSV